MQKLVFTYKNQEKLYQKYYVLILKLYLKGFTCYKANDIFKETQFQAEQMRCFKAQKYRKYEVTNPSRLQIMQIWVGSKTL